MRILLPPAWQTVDNIDPDVRAFYEFYDCQLEPWDGPAALAMTDGRWVCAGLDRNGLRPMRYTVTGDGLDRNGTDLRQQGPTIGAGISF